MTLYSIVSPGESPRAGEPMVALAAMAGAALVGGLVLLWTELTRRQRPRIPLPLPVPPGRIARAALPRLLFAAAVGLVLLAITRWSVAALAGTASQRDEWQAVGLFVLGMLAGGVLASLERRRHDQRQQPHDWPADDGVKDDGLADAEPSLPATLGEALSTLAAGIAASGLPLPPIVGVHLIGDSLEVLLSAPAVAPPPAPFSIAPARQALCWTAELRRSSPYSLEAKQPEPGEVAELLPGLFNAGTTGGGGFLLLDLEAMRVTCCDGPDGLADRLLVTAATELASSQWSSWHDLILVGCDELDIFGRARQCGDVDEALALLETRARLLEGRLRDGGPADVRTRRLAEPLDEDWGLTLLVSRDQPTPEQMTRLLEVTDGHGGIAALVAGDFQAGDGQVAPALFALGADPNRPGDIVATINLADLGPYRQMTVWPRTLSAAEYQALTGAFATAARTDNVSADSRPYLDYGSPPWLRLAGVSAAVVDQAEFARPVSLPEPGEPAPRPRPEDDPAWLSRPGLEMRVLGPVELTGAAEPLQPKQAELVLALALQAPVGMAGSALCELLGPDQDHPRPADWLRQLITRTRRRLGLAADGQEYILHEGSGIYVLHDDVRLDWTEFMTLAGRASADRGAGDLRAALALVRGQPFADCFHWWIDVALVETIRAEIVDAAETLASLELTAGDPSGAARAALAGLAAEPAAEQLWRALMRAEHEAGNLAGVTKAWHGCLDAIAEIAPGADPHPDTERLYRRLTQAAVPAARR